MLANAENGERGLPVRLGWGPTNSKRLNALLLNSIVCAFGGGGRGAGPNEAEASHEGAIGRLSGSRVGATALRRQLRRVPGAERRRCATQALLRGRPCNRHC